MTDQQNVTNRSAHDAAVINEALVVIDGALAKMMQRDLVSTGEVADLLLDVRTLLTDTNSSVPVVEIAELSDVAPVSSDLR